MGAYILRIRDKPREKIRSTKLKLTISELTHRKLFFIAQKYFVKYNLKLNTRRKYDEKSNNYLDANVLLFKSYA